MPILPKSFSCQKGFSPIIIIVIVLIVLIAAGAGGFFVLSNVVKLPGLPSAPSIPGLPAAIILNPNCEYNDPDLCKFLNNWKDTQDYSVKTSTLDEENKKSDSFMAVSGEDKFQMTMSDGGKEVYNMISIKDVTYTKDYTDNKWWVQKAQKLDEEFKDRFDFAPSPEPSDAPEKVPQVEYKKIGKEECGKYQCFKYEVINPSQKDSKEFIYFDDKEYRMRKSRSEYANGAYSESEFSYDKVTVSAPSPTKEAKNGQVVMPGVGAVDMEKEMQEYEQYAKELEKSAKEDQQKLMMESMMRENNASEDYYMEEDTSGY